MQQAVDADGLKVLRDDRGLEGLNHFNRLPLGAGESGGAPFWLLAARIVSFAIVNFTLEDRRNAGLPGVVRRNPLNGTIDMFDSQLRFQRRRSVAVIEWLLQPLQRGCVPSWGQERADGVCSGLHFCS